MEISEKLDQIRKNLPKSEHLMNMTLVYLLALFESFNKKFFQTLLINKPELMKSKKRTINYEKLVDFNSLKELYKYLAEEITNKLGYKDVDKLKDYISKHYNVSLNKEFRKWENLRDNYYRRNIVVHNNGRISKLCIRKLNLSPDLLNSKPIMNIEYITECANTIKNYMDFLFTKIKEKFKLEISVKRFAPLPLNFDKPMIVKKEKDEIFKPNE
jgi:hypothetical protein